jgi:hypothetical protein
VTTYTTTHYLVDPKDDFEAKPTQQDGLAFSVDIGRDHIALTIPQAHVERVREALEDYDRRRQRQAQKGAAA